MINMMISLLVNNLRAALSFFQDASAEREPLGLNKEA